MDEHKFQDELLKYIRNTTDIYVHCNSASMLNSGMPDLTMVSPIWGAMFQENKVWRNKHPPVSAHQIQGLLKGPQVNVVKHQMWKRNLFVPIVALYGINDCYICYKDQIIHYNWKAYVQFIASRNPSEIFSPRV